MISVTVTLPMSSLSFSPLILITLRGSRPCPGQRPQEASGNPLSTSCALPTFRTQNKHPLGWSQGHSPLTQPLDDLLIARRGQNTPRSQEVTSEEREGEWCRVKAQGVTGHWTPRSGQKITTGAPRAGSEGHQVCTWAVCTGLWT